MNFTIIHDSGGQISRKCGGVVAYQRYLRHLRQKKLKWVEGRGSSSEGVKEWLMGMAGRARGGGQKAEGSGQRSEV